jgi:phage shock protein A
MDGVNKTMADVQTTMANAKDLSAGAKSVVVGNKTKLDNMIASLKTAGDNLKAATAEIRRSPWRLLYKPAPNEMANLNLYDAARQFAEGASDLNDTAGALRDAIKNNQTSPEELKKLMDKLDQSFNNFKQVEDKLWNDVKK